MKSVLVFGVLVCWLEMVVFTEGQSYFRMKHDDSGMVAEVYEGVYSGISGKHVRIWTRDDANRADVQQWYVSYESYGCSDGYFIRNKKHNSLVLGLSFTNGGGGWGLPSFLEEQPWACHKRWLITGKIVENLSTNPNGGMVLTLLDGVATNGTQVLVEDPDQSTDQEWICDFS